MPSLTQGVRAGVFLFDLLFLDLGSTLLASNFGLFGLSFGSSRSLAFLGSAISLASTVGRVLLQQTLVSLGPDLESVDFQQTNGSDLTYAAALVTMSSSLRTSSKSTLPLVAWRMQETRNRMCPGLLAADGVDIVNLFAQMRSATEEEQDVIDENGERCKVEVILLLIARVDDDLWCRLVVGIGCWDGRICSCDE